MLMWYHLTNGVGWWTQIDGTGNYVPSPPEFCGIDCFDKNGVPYVGVVYDPMADEMFSAVLGRGAY